MRILSRSLRHYKPKASIFPENSLIPRPNQWLYETRRTLILESAPSQSVKLHRLSDSDSGKFNSKAYVFRVLYVFITYESKTHLGFLFLMTGIVEVSLERPQVRNAIGKDMLKGLQNTFDAIRNDASANVLLIRSKVPKVFCAGADLKVSNPIISFLESMCVCIFMYLGVQIDVLLVMFVTFLMCITSQIVNGS